MMAYIAENWATILTAAAVIAVLALAFAFLSRKNSSYGGCSGDCGSCQSSESCADRDTDGKN